MTTEKIETEGVVFEIERWSISDGPGTRTVVFLKGCPLTCRWCSNPESQSPRPQIGVFTAKCIQCNYCRDACRQTAAVAAVDGGFDPGRVCILCGDCVSACPTRSRRWMGEKMTPDAVLSRIKKDMIFYRKSFGGVTFSGGEPLGQPDFLSSVLKGCRRIGIHTAVETCGAFSRHSAVEAVKLLDMALFDIKQMDSRRHRELTGADNGTILDNARWISSLGIPMVIRIPVIPGLNDDFNNIRATARFVRDRLPSAWGIEPLPYHRLGVSKYAALGLEYPMDDTPPPDALQMKTVREIITSEGVKVITADTDYQGNAMESKRRVKCRFSV